MLMSWMLKFEGYPPGVVVALLLHGILLYVIMPNKFEPADMVTLQAPSYMVASAVKQSPQKLRKIQQLQTQQQNAEAERQRQRQAEAQRQREAEAARQREADAEKQRQAEAARQREAEANRQRAAEAEKQRQAEAEKQRQAEAERQRVAEQQRAAEAAAAQAAASTAAQAEQSVENQLVSQYMAIIQDLISHSWVRPPSARNDMVAMVTLRLTPTGEVIGSTITQSSGDAAFDRSVLQAVDRVGSFTELQDMPPAVFERNFRTFNLLFSPEDLLR